MIKICKHIKYHGNCKYCKEVIRHLICAEKYGYTAPDFEEWEMCKKYYEYSMVYEPSYEDDEAWGINLGEELHPHN